MPFRSEKQRRYLWATHPDIAKRWAHKYPESNKGLPMYADNDNKEKSEKSAQNTTLLAYVNSRTQDISTTIHVKANEIVKNSEDATYKVKIPHSDKPTYAGQEREEGEQTNEKPEDAQIEKKEPENAINSLLQKIALVLSQPMAQALENRRAVREAREPARQPKNVGIRRYAAPVAATPPPMGMQPQPAQTATNGAPVQQPGQGMNSPSAQPINSFGPISADGNINGNAAFGVKNSPDSLKTASGNNTALAKIMSIDGTPIMDPEELDYDDERMKTAKIISKINTKWSKSASFLDDYKQHFQKIYGIDARIPVDYKAMRQLGISTGIGGLMGLARGTFWPGYHEKLDEHGNVVAKKRRSPWRGALEGAAIGAGTSALANYAGQVAAQYNPEIDRFLTGLKNKAVDVTRSFNNAGPVGVDVNKSLFDRISGTV